MITLMFLVTTTLSCMATTVLANPKHVAVVGGGVSGISVARTLKRLGYHPVVLEAGPREIPIQNRVITAGAVYDMDLIYLPSLSWDGVGVEPRFQAVLDEYNIELVKVEEYRELFTWTANNSVVHGNDAIEARTEALKLVNDDPGRLLEELIRMYKHLEPFYAANQYGGLSNCLAEGIGLPNETFGEWASRHGYVNIVRHYVVPLMAVYGALPVQTAPVCTALMLLSNKMPCIMGPLYVLFSNYLHDRHPGRLRNITHTMTKGTDLLQTWVAALALEDGYPNFMKRYKHGYASVFIDMIRREQIDYRFDSRVSQITPNPGYNSSVTVRLSNGDEGAFDFVVVTGRPHQLVNALPDSIPMKSLYREVEETMKKTKLEAVYAVAIVQTSDLNKTTYLGDYIPHQMPITETTPHFQSTGFSLMRVIRTRASAPVLTVTLYTRLGEEATKEALLSKLVELRYSEPTILQMTGYESLQPLLVPDSQWYKDADAAQGHGNIFFTGEVFSGHGVPTSFMFAQDWAQKVFGDLADLPSTFDSPTVKLESSTLLPSLGSQAFTALIRRPVDAAKLGLHPALLVDSATELSSPQLVLLIVLLAQYLLLHAIEGVVKPMLPHKSKQISIYVVELIVSAFAAVVIVLGCSEIIRNTLPKDFLRATRFTFFAGLLVNSLYLSELMFHPRMRLSLKAHHFACLAMYVIVHLFYAKWRMFSVMRMSVINLLQGITEQSVFLLMLLHRISPRLLQSMAFLPWLLTACYVVTRVVIGIMCFQSWIDLLQESPQEPSVWMTLFLAVSLFLFVVQVATQFACFKAQIAIAKRYGKVEIKED